jgi:hypothetical protein
LTKLSFLDIIAIATTLGPRGNPRKISLCDSGTCIKIQVAERAGGPLFFYPPFIIGAEVFWENPPRLADNSL